MNGQGLCESDWISSEGCQCKEQFFSHLWSQRSALLYKHTPSLFSSASWQNIQQPFIAASSFLKKEISKIRSKSQKQNHSHRRFFTLSLFLFSSSLTKSIDLYQKKRKKITRMCLIFGWMVNVEICLINVQIWSCSQWRSITDRKWTNTGDVLLLFKFICLAYLFFNTKIDDGSCMVILYILITNISILKYVSTNF